VASCSSSSAMLLAAPEIWERTIGTNLMGAATGQALRLPFAVVRGSTESRPSSALTNILIGRRVPCGSGALHRYNGQASDVRSLKNMA
jgi:hypothetical protein